MTLTMILTYVTMVRWADVPDSDRGDFRRRRAVDISKFFTPQPELGSRGIVVACRAGGRALPHTVTALPGAVLIRTRSNLVGTNLGAGSRTSSFMGDVAH